MHSLGHFGLTLAISSLLMKPFGNSNPTTIFIISASIVSGLPDIDLSLQRKGYPIHHRGPTHSILSAFLCGIVIAIILYYLYNLDIYLVIGFSAGFVGIMTHLLGDMLTYLEFEPLWPFSDFKKNFDLFSSDNQIANNAFFIIGLICFVYYL